MISGRRRFLISAAGTTAVAATSSHALAQGSSSIAGGAERNRELLGIFGQAGNINLTNKRAAPARPSPLDLAEIIAAAIAKGPGDEDAENLALRAGLLLSEITRDRRDGADFISTGPHRAATKYPYNDDRKREYAKLFQNAKIRPSAGAELTRAAKFITSSVKARYKEVETDTGVPWFVIGALHYREANLNFLGHLHNGDALRLQTVHVPAKRPPKPWTPAEVSDSIELWRLSAKDALTDISKVITNWSLQRMCYAFEAYNGFGCRDHGINSPYLWNYTNWYAGGGFPRDHVFDPEYQSKQAGVIAIIVKLREMDPDVQIQVET